MHLPVRTGKTSYADLLIGIGSKRVIAGGSIKGEVIVLAKRNLPSCTLKLEFTGREYCKILKATPSDHDVEETFDLIPPDTSYPINNQLCTENTMYKHEFVFTVPKSSPATFEANYGSARGYIRYCVSATFSAEGFPELVVWKKVKVSEQFQNTPQISEASVSGYCCTNKGKLKVSCVATNTLANIERIDGLMEGLIDVDNRECKLNIVLLEVKIIQQVHMHAKHRNSMKEGTVVTWVYPDIKAAERKQVEFRVAIPRVAEHKTLCTSTKGCLMKRQYMMAVTPTYESFTCFAPNLLVRFDVGRLKVFRKKD
eukprot:TRINITY_DN8363_c0_g1_i4.p1 TRINITY_DN8363_c0_g1~~TRINITY_DN8363_c0_g1_i4.p1  ORF type:complete len:312 (-),score=57.14 TRINITY_DN8363_c0_g1_i4:68-1003(-)